MPPPYCNPQLPSKRTSPLQERIVFPSTETAPPYEPVALFSTNDTAPPRVTREICSSQSHLGPYCASIQVGVL